GHDCHRRRLVRPLPPVEKAAHAQHRRDMTHLHPRQSGGGLRRRPPLRPPTPPPGPGPLPPPTPTSGRRGRRRTPLSGVPFNPYAPGMSWQRRPSPSDDQGRPAREQRKYGPWFVVFLGVIAICLSTAMGVVGVCHIL